MGAVLATVDCGGGNGIGAGLAVALTEAISLATLRGLDAGSGADSAGGVRGTSNAAYDTRGIFISAFAELVSVGGGTSRPALLSGSEGRSAAAALGAAKERRQPIKSAAMSARAAE
jgi:hypothetical protein